MVTRKFLSLAVSGVLSNSLIGLTTIRHAHAGMIANSEGGTGVASLSD